MRIRMTMAMPHLIQQGKCSFPVPGIWDVALWKCYSQIVHPSSHFNLESCHYKIKHAYKNIM